MLGDRVVMGSSTLYLKKQTRKKEKRKVFRVFNFLMWDQAGAAQEGWI
jgi:hypothetical protein